MKPDTKRFSRVLLALCLLAPSVAHASKDYPQVMQHYFNMKRALPAPGTKGCMLCHKDEAGGTNTATRPFGVTLKKKGGVVGGSPASLQKGLYFVWSHATNSDGDPVSDYTEIVTDGTDPNDGKKYVPPPLASEGGQGGTGAGESGEGGQPSNVVSGPAPSFASAELPPPYVHGCELARARSAPCTLGLLWLGVLGMLGVLGRRRRQRGQRAASYDSQ